MARFSTQYLNDNMLIGFTGRSSRARRGFTLTKSIADLAMKIERRLWTQYENYLVDCEIDRASGYRAHFCEHGTNLWTDYDNICGPCEDGLTLADGVYRRTVALHEAKKRTALAGSMLTTWRTLVRYDIDFDRTKYAAAMSDFLNPEKNYPSHVL